MSSALFFENLHFSRASVTHYSPRTPNPTLRSVGVIGNRYSGESSYGSDSLVVQRLSGFTSIYPPMINTNEVDSGGTASPAHDKLHPGVLKKTALRDVQNENVGSTQKQQESLLHGGGRSNGDAIKVCGSKRLTPECPSSAQSLPTLAYSGTNENVMNARRRFDLELGKGRLHNSVERLSEYKNIGQLRQGNAQPVIVTQTNDNNLHHVPVTSPANLTATMAFPSSSPSVPPFNKHNNRTPTAKISPEVSHTVDSNSTSDQLRTERFIRLQKFLKQCDDSNQIEYTQMLLRIPPSELSKHAVELEKRSIKLTIDEGNEMQRMRFLNIMSKSSPTTHLLQSTQLLQSNKS